MKVKLLKKVRKRFSIFHHPKGVIRYNIYYDNVFFTLYDKRSGFEYRVSIGYSPVTYISRYNEAECINELKNMILKILRNEGYPSKKTNELKSHKIWYN